MKIQRFYRDPENIGWAGCVHINNNMEILLVRNLKREAQILAEFVRQGFTTKEAQDANRRRVIWELSRKEGGLEKPSRWELLGGKISYWQGNHGLQNEFKSLDENAQKAFEEEVGARVLFNDQLLKLAADSTAESEFVEEGGLSVSKKIFLTRVNDPDRTNPKSSILFYPRFWYLVLAAHGTLRTEPVKGSISEPHWIPLIKLHPFSDRDGLYPIHPSHILGICAGARYFIRNGRSEFVEVVDYLERTFGPQKESETFEESSDWESFAKTVQKIN